MTETKIITTDDRIPDLVGPHGKAWKQDFDSFRKLHPGLGPDGSVCVWIVSAPWAHPVWHSYLIVCLFLRDVPGVPPAKVAMAGATHEVIVAALDPEQKRIPLNDYPKMLKPLNFAGQWIAASDEAAAAKIEATVLEIVNGTLSPDTDFLREWVKRFSGSNLKAGVL